MLKQDFLENRHNIIYLGIGSNLGNRTLNIQSAISKLSKVCIINKVSLFYETLSWPNENLPKFLNIIVKCSSNKNPYELMKLIKLIEKKLKRRKTKKNMPRTCDIDIIDFNQKKITFRYKNENVIIPHPRLKKRNFVMIPLFEIEKNWHHPITKESIHNLVKNLSYKSLSDIKLFK